MFSVTAAPVRFLRMLETISVYCKLRGRDVATSSELLGSEGRTLLWMVWVSVTGPVWPKFLPCEAPYSWEHGQGTTMTAHP